MTLLLDILGALACLGAFLVGNLFWQKYRSSRLECWQDRFGKRLHTLLTDTLVAPEVPLPLPAPPSWMQDDSLRRYLREMASYVDPQNLSALQPRLREWGILAYCRRGLRYATHRSRRLQVLTLALLLEPGNFPEKPWLSRRLLRWSQDPNTQVTALALRLLLRLFPDQWPAVVDALLNSVQIWNPTDLRQVLLDLPPDARDRLWGRLAQAHSTQQLRLLGAFLDYDPERAYPLLRDPQADPEVLAQILRRVNTTYVRPEVLALLQHPQDFVRLRAAVALGRIGLESDTEALVPLLYDSNFWVRKRSAEALWHLTRSRPDRWVQLMSQIPPAAQNLLRQVELG